MSGKSVAGSVTIWHGIHCGMRFTLHVHVSVAKQDKATTFGYAVETVVPSGVVVRLGRQ